MPKSFKQAQFGALGFQGLSLDASRILFQAALTLEENPPEVMPGVVRTPTAEDYLGVLQDPEWCDQYFREICQIPIWKNGDEEIQEWKEEVWNAANTVLEAVVGVLDEEPEPSRPAGSLSEEERERFEDGWEYERYHWNYPSCRPEAEKVFDDCPEPWLESPCEALVGETPEEMGVRYFQRQRDEEWNRRIGAAPSGKE